MLEEEEWESILLAALTTTLLQRVLKRGHKVMILHSNEDFQCYEHEPFQVSRILDKDSTLHASEP